MKTIVLATLAALILLCAGNTVTAKPLALDTDNLEIDGSFAFASGPGDFDSGFGVNFGAGYMLNTLVKNLQGRVDVGYFDFSRDVPGTSLSYWRVPITFSARYYVPLLDNLKAFGQAGVETSWDSYEYVDAYGKRSKTQFNIGLSPGAGVELFATKNLSVFGLIRSHWISDSYFSMHFGAAYHF
jgi:opacity protein-like surface antigen